MRADVVHRVGAALGGEVSEIRTIAGGDVSDAYAVTVAGATFFVKVNDDAPSGMFAAEAHGLGWLAQAKAVRVPRVIAVGEDFIALEWLERGPRGRGFDETLGRGLATLHRAAPDGFGLDRDNFIATLAQHNQPAPTWAEFWVWRRLEPMVRRAIDRRGAPARWSVALERLAVQLPELSGPAEPVARLHGDLWHGNVHAAGGEPALIDPAVYGGHREVDLAMLALFGGLSDALVAAYQEVWPLAPGWRERIPLWQLYPLLVHVALFGGGYVAQTERAIASIV